MKKLLLVEDDRSLGFVTRDNLEINGYEVKLAEDGEMGYLYFQSGVYDLCILDVMLPKMDGFTLAKKIREIDEEVPIIFLTAKSLQEDKIEGLRLGGDDYLTKPFSMDELLLKISIFLKRSGKDHDSGYQIGQYEFLPSNLTLRFRDKEFALTQKENAILELFCKNKGKVLKRDDILMEVWGDDDYFLGRSLDVFISRLRKYLKSDASVSIENYHGVGFRLKS